MEHIRRLSGYVLVKVGEALGIPNLDRDSGLIFVTGGTGPIGHRVAERLLHSGYPHVRLGTRNPDHLDELNKMGAEIATFAWDREDTYEHALKGVKSVLCTVPYQKDWVRHFGAFLAACEKAGVKHFVKLSFYHARNMRDQVQLVPLIRAHGDCDALLIGNIRPYGHDADLAHGPMSYTILYATHYMSNPFTFQNRELRNGVPGTFYGASGNHGVNYVSPNDVAEVAVRVLLEPRRHYDKEYSLTGPEAILEQQVADLISKHLDRPIVYVDQPPNEFEDELKFGGEPGWMVKDMVALEAIKASGEEEAPSFVSSDIETICGHSAQNFEEYLVMSETMTKVEMGAPSELKPLKRLSD